MGPFRVYGALFIGVFGKFVALNIVKKSRGIISNSKMIFPTIVPQSSIR
jgi:hypothetical protein